MNGVKKGLAVAVALAFGLVGGAYGFIDVTYVRASEFEQAKTAVQEKLVDLETLIIESALAGIASEVFELTERLKVEPNNRDVARRISWLVTSRLRYERQLETR